MCLWEERIVVNYHRHTTISHLIFADSVSNNEDYAKRCVELGHGILSSCEHGSGGANYECFSLAQKYNLKWRHVAELYLVRGDEEKDRSNHHIILAAKTRKGMEDINFISSNAWIDNFYYRPRITWEMLKTLSPKDVMVTTACIAGIFSAGHEKSEAWLRDLYGHFGNSLFLEVQAHNDGDHRNLNSFILKMYRKYNIPLIGGMDSHYIYPEQSALRNEYQIIKKVASDNQGEDKYMLDYPDEETFFQRFKDQGILSTALITEAISNTDVFYDFEDIEFDRNLKLPTIYPDLCQEEKNKKYHNLIMDSWKEYSKDMDEEEKNKYWEEHGIGYEMDTIISTGMADYFLVLHEIVRRAKEKGGLVTPTGRGSAVSYFTNTLIGLSSVDRFKIPVTLLPDRFISKDRILAGSLPDVDLNLSNIDAFREAMKEVLGEWSATPMIVYKSIQLGSAWRLACRINNIDKEVADKVAEQLKVYDKQKRNASDEERAELSEYDFVDSKYHDLLKKANEYIGVVESGAPHPCAYLLSQVDVRKEFGVCRLKSDNGDVSYVCMIDGVTADSFLYVKGDFLMVDSTSQIHKTYERIGMPTPTVPQLMKMVDGDKETWRMYSDGITQSLNQVEQEATSQKIMRYKPKNETELATFIAGVRPGFASMLETFLSRKHFDYGIPSLDKAIQTPEMKSSMIVFQEQVMTVLMLAGFDPSESYAAIKAISKKKRDKVMALKDKFVDGFFHRIMDGDKTITEKHARETTEKVWQILEDNSAYSFNACFSGDTLIKFPSFNGCKPPTIEEMFLSMNDKEWKEYPMGLSLNDNGKVIQNRIVDIRYAGVQKTYKVILKNGYSVVCTMNHKFPTSQGEKRLLELQEGDKLYAYEETERWEKGYPVQEVKISSIDYEKEENTYDVEMADPYHTLLVNEGIIASNSHAVSMAFDSLYMAWAKGNHPQETYATILEDLSSKKAKDKERLSRIKTEMRKHFRINTAPCRYGQDNTQFYIDKENNTISDALVSCKGFSQLAAKDLYKLYQEEGYPSTFVDLLVKILYLSSMNSAKTTSLIKMGYFSHYGQETKLLNIYAEFTSGKNKYTKTLKENTQQKRLELLREFESQQEDIGMTMEEKIAFEIEAYGTPLTLFPAAKKTYVVIDVDEKYSPKVSLYNVAEGTTGIMKIRKKHFELYPLKKGDIIKIVYWENKPKYTYAEVNGKRQAQKIPGQFELWLEEYRKLEEE